MKPALSKDGQDTIEDFRCLAEEFCGFIDGCGNLDQSAVVHELCVYLAKLCEAGTRLPWVNPATADNDFTVESIAEHSDTCVGLAMRLRKSLGKLDEYWDVFDPTQKEEAIQCSLSMDIAEIYMDLRDALKLSKGDVAAEDVCFQWRFDFHSHWSRHAASALKVVLILSNRV